MHLKYRPKTLEEVFGNEELKKLIPTLNLQRPILIEGSFGSGKTTLARIIANKFGAPEDNIIELDCEYFSKVENMRDELSKLGKSSIFGLKKVLILDEIHGLSDKSLKVLLTPLEDTALLKDVLIIGCTTEIQSISKILLSRLTILKVRPLSLEESRNLLTYIGQQEKFNLEKWQKDLLIEKSDGIPRLLLKNIAIVKSANTAEEARYLLELSSLEDTDEDALSVYKAVMTRDWKLIKKVLSVVLKRKSPNTIRIGIMNLIGARLISDYLKDAEGENLIGLYEVLTKAYGIPEKANLVTALYKFGQRRL